MAAEEWRPVPGFEGLYSVSDLGRVRREATRGRWPAGGILRPVRRSDGRLQVNLCRNSERRSMQVHRLVMAAFVGPCPEGMEVAHEDGNPENNRLDNLRYAPRSENMLDCHRYGGRTPNQKLTLEQVAEVRQHLVAGESCASIARRFGVHRTTISHISTGRNWAHRLDEELVA